MERSEYSINDNKISVLHDKKKQYKIRVTTFLKSSLKDAFINDCLERSQIEAQVAKKIIETHYEIINSIPNSSRMEFIEYKKFILDKITNAI
jgi:hypothetical protein